MLDGFMKAVRDIKRPEYVTTFSIIFGLLIPGILTLWIFDPEFIKQISTAKLILLSITVTFPVTMMNYFIFGLSNYLCSLNKDKSFPEATIEFSAQVSDLEPAKKIDNDEWGTIVLSLTICGIIIYILCFIKMIAGLNINLFIILCVVLNFIGAILLSIGMEHNNKQVEEYKKENKK